MKRTLKMMLIGFLVFATLLIIGIVYFLQRPEFGKLPSGPSLARIEKSQNFKETAFDNLNYTPGLTEGVSYLSVMWEFLISKRERMKPTQALPSRKTNLLELGPDEEVLVWFGHSSYFMQMDGNTFLVDPVFSGSASPLPGGTQAFIGSDIYGPEDLPMIDYLFITHDHWDHLDYRTILAIKPKVKRIFCGLGTESHLEYWGYNPEIIVSMDWDDQWSDAEVQIHSTPARHFSGRGLKRNKTLWTSFVLQTSGKKIFIGGDSGYDTHFATIGEMHGPFDLAILENGQYDENWKYIHMMPEEVLIAAKELKAKALFPVHSSKFALGNHPWDEPLKRISALNEQDDQRLITPMIGEKVMINDTLQVFEKWWVGID